MFGVALLAALLSVTLIVRKAKPYVVVDARSYAVAFVPAGHLELVGTTSPRHGLEPGGIPFAGIRFVPMLPNDALLRAFAGDSMPANAAPRAHSLQRLEVTSGCTVRLELYVDGKVRLDIEGPPPQGAECRMAAGLMLTTPRSERWETVDIPSRPITAGSPATLIFKPPYPLHLRNVPVSALRFETTDTGLVRSAILEARLELPEVGAVGDAARTAYLGDPLTLGEIRGDIAEIVVRDTIRTLFKGEAKAPVIASADLRPTLIEYLAHTHWQLALAVVAGAVAFASAILPKEK